MKAIYAIAFIFLFASCDNTENLSSSSEYVILNEVNGRGNISLYDFSSKSLTENFFTINSGFNSKIYAANKKDKNVVMATEYYPGNLRKIDLTTGTQIKEATSWIEPYPNFAPAIDFHNSNIVVTNAQLLTDNISFRFIVKIYDENLSLLDSIGEANVQELHATSISKDKLFCSLWNSTQGDYIRIIDLNTNTFITSIPLSSRCLKLIQLNENQLLGVQNNAFFILDTQSLSIVKSTVANIGTKYVTLNASENVLYYLSNNAQPAMVPYTLQKISISTGESSIVVMYPESVYPPITYDAKAKAIVTGGLKIFSRSGKVLQDVASPPNTKYIFIK